MREFKIYTAGKMGGLSFEEQMKWRKNLETMVKIRTNTKVHFVHPPEFYQPGTNSCKTENEARIWDLSQVKDSDIVVFNLSNISTSIGTIVELGVVEAMNQFGYKHIHAIGIGVPDTDHPWIMPSLLRHEEDIEAAADYIVDYLLV